MRKMFLRSLACFMTVCMVILLGGFAFGGENRGSERVVTPETEIVVEGISCENTVELITATINGEILITPNSIWCIFGHNISTGVTMVTEHRVFANAPRCRRTTFDVSHCTRSNCNHMVLTLRSQSRIPCCA